MPFETHAGSPSAVSAGLEVAAEMLILMATNGLLIAFVSPTLLISIGAGHLLSILEACLCLHVGMLEECEG